MKRAALWVLPPAFCLWLHWYGLKCWFHSDDFAWLSLYRHVYDLGSFMRILFEPAAQGTIRPWSERGFFLLFHQLFGFDALPYHIFIFLTQFANLALLTWIVRRVSGSPLAAFSAAILWTANTALAIPLSWSSDYNQILCAFFVLSAFALYLAGHYWLQFAVFVLGFGALEINIVYPAILLAWLVLNKKDPRPALALAAVSIVYFLIHSAVAPHQTTGVYALHLDTSIFRTLWIYWSWAFVPDAWRVSHPLLPWSARAIIVTSTLGIAYYIAQDFRRSRNPAPLFFILWFLIATAPVLPLRDHVTDYYLTIPSLGVAAVLGLALDKRRVWAMVVAAAFLLIHVPTARDVGRWYYGRAREVRTLVLGVKTAHDLHPTQNLLLTGISPQLYNFALAHSPFFALGVDHVYLPPDMPALGIEDPGLLPQYVLPAGPLLRGLEAEQIQVYEPDAGRLRNITAAYEQAAQKKFVPETPRRVDVGVPLMAYLLGSTWYPPDGIYRSMPLRATVRIAGPRTLNERLVLTGYCPKEQTRQDPLKFFLSVNGKKISEADFIQPEAPFLRTFVLPPSVVGNSYMDVMVEVNRTFQHESGSLPIGLIFGVFEVR